jgi:hypothetical protein
MLIDVGTKPTSTSLYELYKNFERNPNVGGPLVATTASLTELNTRTGACGEMCVDTGRACGNLWRPLVAAQNFECVGPGLPRATSSLGLQIHCGWPDREAHGIDLWLHQVSCSQRIHWLIG